MSTVFYCNLCNFDNSDDVANTNAKRHIEALKLEVEKKERQALGFETHGMRK